MQSHRLEVFPVGTLFSNFAWRLVARNGNTVLYSGTEGFSKDNALRAARRFNKHFGQGELEIRILNDQGHLIRKTR